MRGSLATCVALVHVLACGGSDPVLTPEPPGINPDPQDTWIRCACNGCTGPNGNMIGFEPVGGCSTDTCGDTAALTAHCATICANYGLTGCTSTEPAAEGPCFQRICDQCTQTSECVAGRCFTLGETCGRECNSSASDCGCEQCIAEAGTAGVCVQPAAGNVCGGTGTPPIYLDRTWGRVAVALDTTSTFSVSSDDISGNTTLASGSVLFIARDCPGPGCTMRINDMFGRLNDFTIDVAGFFGGSADVTQAMMTNVRPATLDAAAGDGSFTIPARGIEVVFGFLADDDRLGANALNTSSVTGGIDFTTGAFHLDGGFTVGEASVELHLTGQVTNLPPVANAGPDQPMVECESTVGATIHLDGTGSTDPNGAGITDYVWFEDFDPHTATGTVIATGATADVILPYGPHTLTLLVQDGDGAMDIDVVEITVVDTTAPVVTVDIPEDCLWPPNHKWVRYDLFEDILVSAQNTCFGNLTDQVQILNVTSSEPEDDAGDGHTGPDVAWSGTALCVRSERSGPGPRRVYTVTVGVTDEVGNTGTAEHEIVVNHSQGHGGKCSVRPPWEMLPDGDPRCALPLLSPRNVEDRSDPPVAEAGCGCRAAGDAGWLGGVLVAVCTALALLLLRRRGGRGRERR